MKRIYLEITNACNLDCPFCTNEKGNRFLSIEDIRKYMPQIKEYSDHIYLHVIGEPLLHPNIKEIFKEAELNNLNINLVTNGTLINNDLLKEKSIRKISISLQSVNNININDDYYNKILNLIDSNTNKYIELRFYDKNHLNNSNNKFLNKLKEKYGLNQTDRKNSYKLKENVYVLFKELFKWPNIKDEIINTKIKCLGAIDQIAILSNGEVTICCLDPKGHNSIGNIRKQSLKEILESKEYHKIKNNMMNHTISKELCKRCSYSKSDDR